MTTDRLHYYSVVCNGLFSCLLCLICISSRNDSSCCTCYISSRLLDSYLDRPLHVSIHSNCTHISGLFRCSWLSRCLPKLELHRLLRASNYMYDIIFIRSYILHLFHSCFMGSTHVYAKLLESNPSSEAVYFYRLSSRTPKTILSLSILSVLSPN